MDVINKCKVPVIAMVRGYCLGAGTNLVSACDIVYCDPSAKFSIREIKIGMGADLGVLQRLALRSNN